MEVVQPTLELVAGVLHSDLSTLVVPKIEDGGAVDGLFDALQDDILNGVERLQLRDAALAKDELGALLRRMRQKFQARAKNELRRTEGKAILAESSAITTQPQV